MTSENKHNAIFTHQIASDANTLLQGVSSEQLFIVTDPACQEHCLPLLQQQAPLAQAKVFVTAGQGDEVKNLETLAALWQWLSQNGATRQSVLLNLGGGVITDLGGFAACTFKRGIRYFNLPTTLLAMVDAACGGKNGINFNGLKNEIGLIHPADAVLIDTHFLSTCTQSELLSGYAEMIKHGLLDSPQHLKDLLNLEWEQPNFEQLEELIKHSVQIKANIVSKDPSEKGIRKSLNLGHTLGHAFESLALQQGKVLAHGYAVAFGLIAELYLSYKLHGFPQDELISVVRYLQAHYGRFEISCDHYEALYSFCQHDKKNLLSEQVCFSLLSNIGKPVTDNAISKETVFKALDFYRDTVGL